MFIGISAKHHRPQRANQKGDTKATESEQQRDRWISRREKDLGNIAGKEAVHCNIKPLQGITNTGGKKRFRQVRAHAALLCLTGESCHFAPPF